MYKQNKRRLLALLLSATAVLALAGPATASAAVWKDAGVTVAKAFEIGVTGAGSYEPVNGEGGVQCSERFIISFNGVSTTTVSKFENKGSCKTFGSYVACTVSTVEMIGTPSVTLGTSTLTINSMHMKHTFKAGCAKGEINQTLNVTLTPDLTTKISSLEFLGLTGTYKQYGTYTVETPTYGIG
jgi:hypothetical protein